MVDAEKESVLMQLLAKAKKIPTDNCFIIFDWNECLKMLAPHSLLVSHWPRSPWPPFDPFIHDKCDFMWTLSLSSLATGQDKSCLSTFFPPTWKSFFFHFTQFYKHGTWCQGLKQINNIIQSHWIHCRKIFLSELLHLDYKLFWILL